MRLTFLVIASDNLKIYSAHQSLWRSYATSHPDVTVYFVRQSKETLETHIDGDTIWSNGEEATERVFEKTVEAFKILSPSSYDFLVRTNLSSVWNFTRLIEFCETLPKKDVFCGVLGNPGISGAGMILSPDVVRKLANHSGEIERCKWDDIDFGKVANLCGIPSIPATRYDPRTREHVDACWNVGYHFYLKDMRSGIRNIENELDIMQYLISKVYAL